MDCGWATYGVDCSIAGIEKHNPRVAPFLTIGDAISDIDVCIEGQKQFFWLMNTQIIKMIGLKGKGCI